MREEVRLRTARLRLAPDTDAAMAARVAGAQDPHMRAAYGEMLDGCRAHPEARVWYAAWGIALPDGTPVGDLCFKGPPVSGEVEIGYGIEDAYQGRGYATEAVMTAVAWARAQPGVQRVVAETEPDNRASQRVLEKAGFHSDGMGAEGPRFKTALPMRI